MREILGYRMSPTNQTSFLARAAHGHRNSVTSWCRQTQGAIDRVSELLDGFSPAVSLGCADWSCVPQSAGVYVILDRSRKPIYVGKAGRNGKGSLRGRLRDHASGQVVNMFVQYVLFDAVLPKAKPLPRTPQEATRLCREYIREHCSFRFLAIEATEATDKENELIQSLNPKLNGIDRMTDRGIERDLARSGESRVNGDQGMTQAEIAEKHGVPKTRVYWIHRRMRERAGASI